MEERNCTNVESIEKEERRRKKGIIKKFLKLVQEKQKDFYRNIRDKNFP